MFVGVTHKPWFDRLARLAPDEVKFWQASGTGEFKALRPGDPFFSLEADERPRPGVSRIGP